MKLNDVYTKPLKDVVEELNLTDMNKQLRINADAKLRIRLEL